MRLRSEGWKAVRAGRRGRREACGAAMLSTRAATRAEAKRERNQLPSGSPSALSPKQTKVEESALEFAGNPWKVTMERPNIHEKGKGGEERGGKRRRNRNSCERKYGRGKEGRGSDDERVRSEAGELGDLWSDGGGGSAPGRAEVEDGKRRRNEGKRKKKKAERAAYDSRHDRFVGASAEVAQLVALASSDFPIGERAGEKSQ